MWVFVPGGFASIVAHRDRPGQLLVRARRREDLERFYAGALMPTVHELAEADYRFRVVDERRSVANLAARHVQSIDYDNFKAHPANQPREGMLLRVWIAVSQWAKGA